MVHALKQARRVLQDDGYLLDLRPALTLRHVGIEANNSYRQVAIMNESVEPQRSADRAVQELLKAGLLNLKSRTRFECTRRMRSYVEFQNWIEEPDRLSKIRSPELLLETVKVAWQSCRRSSKSQPGKLRIQVHGPLDLSVLTKTGSR